MSVLRLGSNESEREGVVLEKSNHGNRVTLRGWSGKDARGNVHLIPAEHFTLQEIADFLGLRMPEAGTRKPRKERSRHPSEELST